MGKSIDYTTVLDVALSVLEDNVIEVVACSAEPTTYAEATSTYALADVAVTDTDFTIANGDTSGRKVTCAEQTGVTVDSTGTITHVAWCSGSVLYYVTTTTSQAVTSGGTITIPAHDYEIRDPS